jgi:acetyl-CoA synthetase
LERRFNFDVDKGNVSAEFFIGAKTNVCYNCLDRHVAAGHGDRVAFFWEGNDCGQQRVVTYRQLLEVCVAAGAKESPYTLCQTPLV